jgi:putative ABC transport system ATP-binding protein
MVTDAGVVRTQDLCKDYLAGAGVAAVHALRDVNMEVAAGEMVAIMGPSGSGKTTLLNMLGCVDSPTRGHYWLGGEDTSRMGDKALSRIRNEKIGFVFQSFNLLPGLTVAKNVRLPSIYSAKRTSRQAEFRALERVGLADRAHHLPSQLSGGQQQRVAIARALVTNPAMILADEPTGNLDEQTADSVMDLLFGLCAETGTALVLVTHNAGYAARTQRQFFLHLGVLNPR